MITLEQLNRASTEEAAQLLDGLYEHSPWIVAQALGARPFVSLADFKYRLAQVLENAGQAAQLALIRAHPELAGKAMVSKTLTAESRHEQGTVGLTACTPEEFSKIQQLNTDYLKKFGFPFILAVRGPRATGLRKRDIFATFERRLNEHPEFELKECLRQIHRIAEIRLNDKFGDQPLLGQEVWDWHEDLAQFSDPGFSEKAQLTVTYLTDAHRACASSISARMRECGFDHVHIDAVGNVVGRYHASTPQAPSLLTGSHYDTVRNGGKYDGRLGIFIPMICVRELARSGQRLPFHIELIAFAEEEGQRYSATFLGSSALVGDFKTRWLEQVDSNGISMRQAMADAGLQVEEIASLQRDPKDYIGFVEVHIEQGPVLNALNIPLGIVTSINGSVRLQCELIGMASHAGTTPMGQRRDAATAAAELALYVEIRAAQDAGSVGTIGILQVPNGSVNVVPGRCQFSLDLRAPTDLQRDALLSDVLSELALICQRRGLRYSADETMRASAAPSAPAWQDRWEKAVASLGVALYRMPSGAGHDAMKLHQLMPQAMLFVRGENSGISHNPLESTTSDDMALAINAFSQLLTQFQP